MQALVDERQARRPGQPVTVGDSIDAEQQALVSVVGGLRVEEHDLQRVGLNPPLPLPPALLLPRPGVSANQRRRGIKRRWLELPTHLACLPMKASTAARANRADPARDRSLNRDRHASR